MRHFLKKYLQIFQIWPVQYQSGRPVLNIYTEDDIWRGGAEQVRDPGPRRLLQHLRSTHPLHREGDGAHPDNSDHSLHQGVGPGGRGGVINKE